jgi:hypothetical protein
MQSSKKIRYLQLHQLFKIIGLQDNLEIAE